MRASSIKINRACLAGIGAVLAVWMLDPYGHTASTAMLHATALVLEALGIVVRMDQNALIIGKLTVPWTAECAGISALPILAVVVLWTHRSSSCGVMSIVWRLLLVVPVALLANRARVLTVIGFRHAVFPAVESPQLHALMGLVWLLPAVAVFVPRESRRDGRRVFLESVHLAAVIALLTPLVAGPGAPLIAGCTMMLWLDRASHPGKASSQIPRVIWLVAGGCIASAAMESLWLAWLLACPWNGSLSWRRPFTWLLLAGTMPLVAMRTISGGIVGIALLWSAWSFWRSSRSSKLPALPGTIPRLRWAAVLGLAPCFIAPFAASAISHRNITPAAPAIALRPTSIAPGHYELHLAGQHPAIRIDWFEPQGGGRHHTLAVCMRYRGCILREVDGSPGVLTDGHCWRREFFLVGDHLCQSYSDYLLQTLIPGSPTGVHLILATRCASMTAAEFAAQCSGLGRHIHALARPAQPMVTKS